MCKRSILVFIMIILGRFAYAGGPGTTGGEFLKIGIGGRGVALGEAYCAISDDATAPYWNPSGLTQIKTREISTMYTSWFQDITHQFLSYAQPFRTNHAFGVSLIGLQIAQIEERLEDTEEPVGKFSATNYACTLSYAHRLNETLSLGGNLKFISERIKDERGRGLSLDVGGLYKPNAIRNLSLGLNIQNITLQRITFIEEGDVLPFNIKAGVAYKMFGDNLMLALDLNLPSDNDLSYHFGTEYRIKNIIALRAGYNSQISGNKLGSFNLGEGLSVGLGVEVMVRSLQLQLDYVYVPYGDLGDAHRASFTIGF